MSDTSKNHGFNEPENGDRNIDNTEKDEREDKNSGESGDTNNSEPVNPDNSNDQKDVEKSEINEPVVNSESQPKEEQHPEESQNDLKSTQHSDVTSTSENITENSLTKPDETVSGDTDREIQNKSEADTVNKTEESATETTSEIPPVIPPINTLSKSKESNYQISLIDENLLKINVTTKNGVRINSSVREKDSSVETQSNEIYLNPRYDYSQQEVEVMIAIEEPADHPANDYTPANPETSTEQVKEVNENSGEQETAVSEASKSNYQINLINENLLRVKILTNKRVRIDSVSRDKNILSQTQSNKIDLNPKNENEIRLIEITVAIDTETKEFIGKTDDGKIKLIPNPEVMDLISPPDYSPLMAGDKPYGDSGYNNPFDSLRKLIRKNITIGITAAVILHLAVAAMAFYSISKKTKEQTPEEETSRLIVIQDLPDPKIRIENVEDPNKPKVIEPPVTEDPNKIPERHITPRKTVKPPSVNRPKRETEDTKLDSSVDAQMTRELDSLRRLTESGLDSIPDSTVVSDSINTAFDIPDSLRNSFSENDIGLAMYFPKNWKLTDQRDINKNEKEFKGVVLTDTTAEQPGTMTMFIFLDYENKDYNAEDFKTEFKMNDSTLSGFLKEPKTLAGFTEYRFYIFNKIGTEKLSLRASVRKQFFDQYKNEIEAVVRSLKIRKKEDLVPGQ